MADFWTWYNKNGIIPNIWKGIIGAKDQENINNANLEFQRENLDYQKSLQNQIFEREDNAYQRTVNDMRAAGLNPVAMQGTNGSGEAIQTEAQHGELPLVSSLSAISQIFDVINQVKTQKNNSTLANAQADLISAQADNQRIKNLWENDLLENTVSNLKFDTIGKKFQNEISSLDMFNKHMNMNFLLENGLTENMPESVMLAKIMSGKGGSKPIPYNSHKDNFGGESYYNFEGSNDYSLKMDSSIRGSIVENKVIDALLKLLSGLNPLMAK